jgi:dTDP-4-amino-4,6-dideoxy-D-glucose/dTDP-4-amino-2,4-dideoxy-beta-L-xylose transaminase
MNKIIPLFKVFMSEESIKRSTEVLKSGYIGQGPVVDEFEENLKKYFNHDYILTLNSATSAEHLALHLLKKPYKNWGGIEPDDEILSSPMTCTATNWPILANNFKIKWVDIDPNTLNMDLDDLSRKITHKTKAIMIVHWGGYPNDLDRLKLIQEKSFQTFGFKPAIIEDCAYSLGSKYKGKLIGTHGNICTFSLQAIKHVTSGDGGILSLPYIELYKRGKLLRWYGIDRETNRKDFRCESDIEEWGYKFHMNDINAAIGIGNFYKIDEIISKHIENAQFYDNELKNIAGITLLERNPNMESSFWIYSMKVEKRDNFMNHMKKHGIIVSQVHERNDIHTTVNEYKTILPNLDKTIKSIISIPVGWWITEEDRKYIIDVIKKGW